MGTSYKPVPKWGAGMVKTLGINTEHGSGVISSEIDDRNELLYF
jgi:hypothetical protein